ncbi:MAG: hypothetical protein ABIV51_01010 [Saprospiraceae bacterium]
MKHVLLMPGTFFFKSHHEMSLVLNNHEHSAFVEWDVPFKNFDLLNPLGDDYRNLAESTDKSDESNYFPFQVLP